MDLPGRQGRVDVVYSAKLGRDAQPIGDYIDPEAQLLLDDDLKQERVDCGTKPVWKGRCKHNCASAATRARVCSPTAQNDANNRVEIVIVGARLPEAVARRIIDRTVSAETKACQQRNLFHKRRHTAVSTEKWPTCRHRSNAPSTSRSTAGCRGGELAQSLVRNQRAYFPTDTPVGHQLPCPHVLRDRPVRRLEAREQPRCVRW